MPWKRHWRNHQLDWKKFSLETRKQVNLQWRTWKLLLKQKHRSSNSAMYFSSVCFITKTPLLFINQANSDSLCTTYYICYICFIDAGSPGLFLPKAWKITLKICIRGENFWSSLFFFFSYSKRCIFHGHRNKLAKFSANWSNSLITFG